MYRVCGEIWNSNHYEPSESYTICTGHRVINNDSLNRRFVGLIIDGCAVEDTSFISAFERGHVGFNTNIDTVTGDICVDVFYDDGYSHCFAFFISDALRILRKLKIIQKGQSEDER